MIDERIISNLQEQLSLARSINQETLTIDVIVLTKLLVEITMLSKTVDEFTDAETLMITDKIADDLQEVLAEIKRQNKLEL
jgi:hypothetical protein